MADNEINSQSNQEVIIQDGKEYRRSIAHLPAFYRTDTNHRFLSSTIDPLIQKGSLERLDGWVGKLDAYTRKTNDVYIPAVTSDRKAYQLEPAVTYTDQDTSSVNPEDQVKFTGTYDDYINQLKYLGAPVNNHDRLNKEVVYSWNPAVDFDKLVNYREYYWLPEGPNAITIDSVGPNASAEIKVGVTTHDGSTVRAYVFGNKPTQQNPQLTLYRGNTYKFVVDAKEHPFWIMTEPYRQALAEDDSTSLLYTSGVTNAGTDSGTVTFTVPTDAPDVLYYQCGNHDNMNGIFAIKTISSTTKINVAEEIKNTKNYSLRTLSLSNGMKIRFEANVTDETTYKAKEFYVEGVGEAITLTNVTDLITPESYATETTIPYDSVAYDTRPYAKAFYRPETHDYITIKRDSRDQNAWSRYNRWFHKSVIDETSDANGYTPNLLETDRAKRPIIEFDSGIQLYDHGTVAKTSITLIDTVTTDAFSTVVNQIGYIVDGLSLQDGMRVIFTADTDPIVKNKVYVVNFVHLSDGSTVVSQDSTARIALTEASDATPANNECVFVEFGTLNQGKTYYYDSSTTTWKVGQVKTAVNQQPLMSLFDNNQISFDNSTTYPNSTFAGAKIFAFKISTTATTDTVLGLKIKYNTLNNTGDIVFESDFTSGTFTYKSGDDVLTHKYETGHIKYNLENTTNRKTAWIQRTNESKQRVIRTSIVTDTEKQFFPIDFYKESVNLTDLEVTVTVNGVKKVLATDYTLVDGTVNEYVKFNNELEVGDQVKLIGYSATKKVAGKGIYEVPENLSINSLNSTLTEFTYGQISNHVKDIVEKNSEVTGTYPGPTTLRDVPDAKLKGGTILQHTGSLTPAVFGLIDKNANLISALDYANREYQKFYDGFLTYGMTTAYEGVVADRVDEILIAMNKGKTNTFPFYYEDMIGWGENFSLRTYTVMDSSETEYAIDSLQDMTTPSSRAVYVYLNDVQLVLGTDYTISTTDDSVDISATIVAGDIIKIRDYSDTTGSFIPPTPTKLGMYPKFKPEKVTDNTYLTSTDIIIGHDGSKRKAYGDYRDDLLLELEKRIYNNIKTAYDSTLLDVGDVMPSAFYSTEYTIDEVNDVLGPDFYLWAGSNGVQYISNTTYNEANKFTYNYSASNSALDNNEKLPGHWRGIYKYFYDTDRPHISPWEIMGHSEKPSDWETLYGTAPYTSGNIVMWEAIAAKSGRYGKLNATSYIPVDESGNLLDPIAAKVVKHFNVRNQNANWKFGDQAPAETAWRRSSAYPFTLMKLLALTKPAKFFGLFFDNSRITKNISNNIIDRDTDIRQTFSTAKYHLESISSVRQITSGYQPWIVNYLISKNLNPATFFYNKMKQLNVQLAYKLGGFTDKANLKVLTDSVSPASTSGSQFIPDENYKILFRTSNPVNSFHYSGVLIEKNTDIGIDGSTLKGGYKILGYSTVKPYFTYYEPMVNGNVGAIEVAGVRVKSYKNWYAETRVVAYGHVFETIQAVVNFLLGYGKWLEAQGFQFEKFSPEIKEVINWETSVKEFLYWTTQNWAPGAAITVSPSADGFTLDTDNSIVGQLKNLAGTYTILDSGGRSIPINKISTKRFGKTFSLSLKDPELGLYNIALNTVQKEHILLFDNETVFSDILFDKITGFRQARLKVVGWKTGSWNGDYYAPGFVFDQAQVNYWLKNTDYQVGDTVEYQGKFYVAKLNHGSGAKFVYTNWILKGNKPAPQLIPNFDYKISQFNDFYDLETNNFDESQQSLAQHLIGYQSRDYLENLFVNDISQYKFYQGYIREKGTQNAIDKLLKAKFDEDDINIDLYPEWMVRKGEFGNANGKENIQVTLDDTVFTSNFQSLELLDTSNDTVDWAKSVSIVQDNFYAKPIEYTASTTFSQYDYSAENVDRDNVQIYKTAGYPRVTQVQHTAFNSTDLLNLDVNSITATDLIWIANKTNNDWDVQRITNAGIKIAGIQSVNDATQLQLTFTGAHSFSAGSTTTTADYMAIANSESEELNGVYIVQSVDDYKRITIDYAGDTGFIPAVEDGSTADTYGNVYKFVSVRLSTMNNVNALLSYRDYKDLDTVNEKEGDKVFVDNDANSLWTVYEKQDPYTLVRRLSPDTNADQDFGYQIVARNDGRTAVVSAPTKGQGTIHFLFRSDRTAGTTFTTQSSVTMTDNDDNTSKLGYSLSMSTDENFVVAGAPYTNAIGDDGSTRFIDSGLIKIYAWNSTSFTYGILNTITPPTDGSSANTNLNFGWSHKICEPGADSVRSTTTKYLFVGAPGSNSDNGVVYMYEWSIGSDGSTYDTWTQNLTITSSLGNVSRFGHRLAANDNGDILAVSSTSSAKAGAVEIFRRTSQSNDDSVDHSFTLVQTLTGTTADGSTLNTSFGSALTMSKDGTTLIVGAPGADNTDQPDAGAVYYYKWNADGSTNTYTLQQTINAPDTQSNQNFGSSVDINASGNRLVIGAEKFANAREMKFDSGSTTFDLQDTRVVDENIGSGGAYTATMYHTEFVIDDKLVTTGVSANDDFGKGVCIIDQTVFVGAPDDDGNTDTDGSTLISNDGTTAIFDLTKDDTYSWKSIASETALIDKDKIASAFLFNSATNKIIDHLDLYDPVKGRILGIADREINIKTTWDPAVYNFGPKANSKISWAENHIGEVWWDLSKVKWIWYEQGDQEFKTNNWGKVFPGSSIDIYEWVETTLLPSEWVAQSTTLVSVGSFGTPYKADDTEFTLKQKYDSTLDGFVNYYYYWVKNSTVLPENSVVDRVRTTSAVATIISNPSGSGLKYFSVTDKNKLIINNIKNDLVNDYVVLNVDYKTNSLESEPHSVWKLIKEGDKDSRPDSTVEAIWWDSLIGQNSAGNKVPDVDLPINERYGTNIRPRQSWYIDRYDALKEIIDYANSILKINQLADTIDYTNLNSADPEPTVQSLEWDASVDTYADLSYIDTRNLSGTVNYLVKADENINGYWAIHQWNGTSWNRTKVQTYNTSKYYAYVDWYQTTGSMVHDEDTLIDKQVTYQYELDALDLDVGKHVKVTSADTGGWKIFMKTSTGWENVATENGTIQLSTKLYDYSIDDTGFAGEDNFDDNFFDQEPALETRKILTALRDNIFINELSIYYNTLFFTGLRKVLAEQTYVDWMFKTSFINVKSSVRALDQRKTYTTGRDAYVESYINEVKPFHTKLREYKLGYTSTDTQDGINTDFDNPPFYDSDVGKIRNINTTSDTTKLTEYPWRMWNDYHKKHVASITLTAGGSGYETAPTVSILGGTTGSSGPFQIYDVAASGLGAGTLAYFYPLYTSESQANIADTQNSGSGTSRSFTFTSYSGTFYMPTSHTTYNQSTKSALYKMYTTPDTTAATATATIKDGSVTAITVTGIGANYTSTPTVLLTGGGSDGLTPSDKAKAYANLNNDLARDFDMTMRFDRISSTSIVQDWAASTSYEYGALIRYNNELYKTTKALTTGTTFSENNLYKFTGAERKITAADRIQGMYTPTSGMPGIELSQVMSGVDYGGTVVTGLLFSEGQGWDKTGWYDFPWDHFGSSSVLTWYGDGSTVAFSFATAPSFGDVYTLYYDATRQTGDVFRGDGSTTTFSVSTAPGAGVKVELIKFDDDTVLTPTDDKTLDSLLTGGLFNTALGIAPSDLLLEGDDFISPDTSYAPEEAVPGQLFDTLDIKVYTSPESGTPFITTKNYRGDGSTTTFAIGDYPGTLGSVTVSVNGSVKKLTTDYTINVKNKTITFGTAPVNMSVVSTKTFAISGENYRVLDVYTGDGSTTQFTTSTRENFNLDSANSQVFITIDGVPTTAYTTTSSANTIIVTFTSAPAANTLIQVAGFNQTSATRAYAEIRQEQIQYDGSTVRYTLTYPPGAIGPYSGLTIIEVNGKVLRGPDNTYYLGDGSTYTYSVVTGSGLLDDSTVDPAKTITSASEVEVYVNGTKKDLNTHYTVDVANQNVDFVADSVPTATDVIAISTLVDNHYYNDGNDFILKTTQMTTDGYTLSANDYMNVTTFNNALGMKQRREVLEGISSGILKLRFDPIASDYMFVWVNGKELIQNHDFTVSGNTITIISQTLTQSDRIDVMYFAGDTNTGATGFRIFKDMLNRSFYRRISKTSTTQLDQDLLPGDKTITVVDGSKLPSADGSTNLPAVIFIDKERIEYFEKNTHVLSQLRRGTLGTGIKVHRGGTEVVDASGTQTIPYADTVYTNTFTGDGSTVVFALSQTPASASELDIFIGGQRLLLTSEDGSTINYSVDGSTTAVTLSSAPASGTQIKILHKKGQVWYTAADGNPSNGQGLQASTTPQAKFIGEEPTNAPE